MRKIIILTAFLAVSYHASAQSEGEKQHIQAPLIRFFDAMSAMNEQAIRAEASPEFSLLENGKIWNTDSLLNSINRYRGLDMKRINHLDFMKTKQKGNVAWVSYFNTADLTYKGRQIIVKWIESAVLIKDNGRWKIELLHSTELKPAAETSPKK